MYLLKCITVFTYLTRVAHHTYTTEENSERSCRIKVKKYFINTWYLYYIVLYDSQRKKNSKHYYIGT